LVDNSSRSPFGILLQVKERIYRYLHGSNHGLLTPLSWILTLQVFMIGVIWYMAVSRLTAIQSLPHLRVADTSNQNLTLFLRAPITSHIPPVALHSKTSAFGSNRFPLRFPEPGSRSWRHLLRYWFVSTPKRPRRQWGGTPYAKRGH
jgi:hypothetical protein